ncbi:hypothetical protein KAK07_02765 [Ideonella sp. 4Y16]|uniref:hypothetical protein n=1 Tax=Ideonella alba TaxID=2824118 RepID=UPI001B36053E|nr:hypothetical protein [Ideonella alba]MBQ0942252.1 hypothetical protein [Ideonella alba]
MLNTLEQRLHTRLQQVQARLQARRQALTPPMLQVACHTQPLGALFAPGGPSVQLQRANGGRKPVKIELVQVDDLTESVLNRAQVIADTSRAALEALEKTALEVRFGYIGARDRDYGEADEVRVIHGSSAQLLREQQTVVRAGGGDPEEPFGDTLIELLEGYPFTQSPDVVRAVLLTCNGHSKPTRQGLSPLQVGERLRDARTFICVVGEAGSNTEDFVTGAGAYGIGFLELHSQPTPQQVQAIAHKLTGTLMGSLTQTGTGTLPDAGPISQLQPTGYTLPNP